VATEELAGGGLQTTTQAAPATEASGTGTGRSRRLSFGWAGLLPFFIYVFIFFLLPIGVILYSAFRKDGPKHRDPVTQQFVASKIYTTQNLSATLHGIYRTSMMNSIELSGATAIIGAVFGMFLAYAVVTSRSGVLRQIVIAAAAVMANFGGIPLAFLFIATVGFPAGALTIFLQDDLHVSLSDDLHFQLTTVTGIGLVYLYFLIPLMVLVMSPALEGLKPQWAEAAENLGASRWHYWRYVAGPVLLPSFLGSVLLLFCSAFSAYATADALVGDSFPLIPTQISNVLSGNVLSGQENLGAALALDMVVIVLPLTVIYQLLQRRTSKWLA
jgi:putative spermidine/putrescine transport system permease protein